MKCLCYLIVTALQYRKLIEAEIKMFNNIYKYNHYENE